jgi:hypothetical protein
VPPAAAKQSSLQHDIARRAVGKGIRHGFLTPALPREELQAAIPNPTAAGNARQRETGRQSDSLTQLTTNYRNSLNDMFSSNTDIAASSAPSQQGDGMFLNSNSSLIDLAMIPGVEEADDTGGMELQQSADEGFGWGFIDFPNPEVFPSSKFTDDNYQDD